jgi:hypothetical protein
LTSSRIVLSHVHHDGTSILTPNFELETAAAPGPAGVELENPDSRPNRIGELGIPAMSPKSRRGGTGIRN